MKTIFALLILTLLMTAKGTSAFAGEGHEEDPNIKQFNPLAELADVDVSTLVPFLNHLHNVTLPSNENRAPLNHEFYITLAKNAEYLQAHEIPFDGPFLQQNESLPMLKTSLEDNKDTNLARIILPGINGGPPLDLLCSPNWKGDLTSNVRIVGVALKASMETSPLLAKQQTLFVFYNIKSDLRSLYNEDYPPGYGVLGVCISNGNALTPMLNSQNGIDPSQNPFLPHSI